MGICMEVMDTSVDKFYARVFKNGRTVPEPVLGKIAFSVVSALHYLHTKLKVIHRDVKPSNILVNTKGEVKMCDFGISGYLVDSVAKTIDAGCKPYMAPERIDPTGNPANYDVWSNLDRWLWILLQPSPLVNSRSPSTTSSPSA